MPHIRINGLDIPKVKQLSKDLSENLAEVVECPIDWISFSVGAAGEGSVFCNGELAKDTVFAYVEWFDRGLDAKNAVAKIITDSILGSGKAEFSEVETVDVIFIDLDKSNYYENGEHF